MNEQQYNDNGTDKELFIFDSMTEVLKFVNPQLFQARSTRFVGERLSSWDAVAKRSDRCWAEGMYTMQQFVEKLKDAKLPELKSRKRQVRFNNDDGDEVDLDRLRSGQEYFRKSERDTFQGPSEVSVYIDTTTACGRRTEDILWRGAAAIALAHILEERGYRVQLWCVNGSNLWRRTKVYTATCLKRAGDPLDTSTLINTVSGWFYRTATFTLLDTLAKHRGQSVNMGYGHIETPLQRDLDRIQLDEQRIYSSGVYSFSGALSMIEGEVAKLAEMQ